MKKQPIEYFINKASKIHNQKFDYSDTNWYSKNIEVVCPIHGKFSVNRGNHLKGHDCVKCVKKLMRVPISNTNMIIIK